jgi:hypothetical protein
MPASQSKRPTFPSKSRLQQPTSALTTLNSPTCGNQSANASCGPNNSHTEWLPITTLIERWSAVPPADNAVLPSKFVGVFVQDTQTTTKVLGLTLTAPGLGGLLRMLSFLLVLVGVVEGIDILSGTAWASEGSVALIVGAFSGFLLNECGVNLAKHGWRAIALMMAVSSLVFLAASLVV